MSSLVGLGPKMFAPCRCFTTMFRKADVLLLICLSSSALSIWWNRILPMEANGPGVYIFSTRSGPAHAANRGFNATNLRNSVNITAFSVSVGKPPTTMI
eukprot:7446075-Pyramimonas_sp.AAC.1